MPIFYSEKDFPIGSIQDAEARHAGYGRIGDAYKVKVVSREAAQGGGYFYKVRKVRDKKAEPPAVNLKIELVEMVWSGRRRWGILLTRGKDYTLYPIDHYRGERTLPLVKVERGQNIKVNSEISWFNPEHQPPKKAVEALDAANREHYRELEADAAA